MHSVQEAKKSLGISPFFQRLSILSVRWRQTDSSPTYGHTNTQHWGQQMQQHKVVTSLLGKQVTNEPEHIVLALEMSRGVKMSPQIASGHQMSPLYSAPHLTFSPTPVCPRSNLLLFLFFFALLSICSPLFTMYCDFLSVDLSLLQRQGIPFHFIALCAFACRGISWFLLR